MGTGWLAYGERQGRDGWDTVGSQGRDGWDTVSDGEGVGRHTGDGQQEALLIWASGYNWRSHPMHQKRLDHGDLGGAGRQPHSLALVYFLACR